ncbi:hypothetical protein RhiXN_04634 [Rhizoctonia solani]|uniref:Uncharacterized protein n=1 Tax=Rhizoctonia solani TaxID=456999 RepID=A0A8H8SU15_9AGAM|nr:uncharacterized protein RhiXN_04634 [Rhizoctonia solani]QRW16633.1 hypothetical protein RhiXN_04634 [Rhizoctonia solani]
MWLVPLVYHLSFEANLPSATNNIWDVFPFNNANFCSRFGLAKGKGLSTPLEGAIGNQFSEEIKLKWPAKAAGTKHFLQWLDKEMRQWFTVQQSKTGGQTKAKGKKGKGKARQQSSNSKTDSKDKLDKIGAPINKLQAGWKHNAPKTNFKDWDWLIAHAFGALGSLFEQLQALMKEFSCNAKTVHKVQRFEKAYFYFSYLQLTISNTLVNRSRDAEGTTSPSGRPTWQPRLGSINIGTTLGRAFVLRSLGQMLCN